MPGASTILEEHVATTNASDGGFRRWRRSRPFWGGLLLLIAGLELFLSANLTLGDLEVHLGPEGFLSYLLPLLLVLCGVLSWVTPGQRLFYGILGLLTAVYSLVGLNLGGFGLGMLIGIIGGALVLAWAPTRHAPEPTVSEEDQDAEDAPGEPEPQYRHTSADTTIVPGFTGGPDDPGGRRAPVRPTHQPETSRPVPGQRFPSEPAYPGAEPPPEGEPPSPGLPGRTFAVALIALALTASVLVAGSRSPARAAAECPEGLPSRPAAAATKEAARQPSAKPSPSRPAAKKKPSAEPSVRPEATGKTGNPIVDGWNGFVDGVGDLLGIGDDAEGEAEPGPSGTPTPSGSATPSSPAPAPSGTPETSASAAPSPSLRDVPCLGPRVFKQAGPDDTPLVSVKGSVLETDKLTMYNSTYDGVVKLDTAKGKLSALKFSMSEAVNEPFSLTVPEPGDRTTLIKSKRLITKGAVRFYTPEFKGKLFGLIPVTFTPESPPPLTLPVLWFTDVTINLAFVRCDTLTGVPLRITEA